MKTSSPNANTPTFEQYRARSKQPHSVSALYTGSEEFTQQCVFCKKNHKFINCMTITEAKARRTILRRNGKCFVCLKGGPHISTNCPSKSKCFNCEGRHHVTICERIRNIPDYQQLGLNVHVIFDSCSQRPYITSKACEQLNLPTIGKETLLIIGDNSASVKECDVVQLCTCVITWDDMNVYTTSYVVPVICSPVSNQRSQTTLESYPYLQGLQLACDTSDSVSVDVLIGADH